MNVIFFPRNDYPDKVEICNHRLGKKMTYCERTTLIPSYVQDTILPYFVTKHNSDKLRVGCDFMDVYTNSAWNSAYGKQCIENGTIWADLYFYPDPFEDMSQEAVMRAYNRLLPWFISNFGRKPNAVDFSSGYGSQYKQYLTDYFLCCDSSAQQLQNNSDYGVGVGLPNNVPYTQSRYYPRVMNSRVLDNARADITTHSAYNTPSEKDYYDYYINQISDLIDDTLVLPNGGFIMNFHHWHDLVLMDYNADGTPKAERIAAGTENYAINNGFKSYVDMLCQKNANDEIYFAGYGEAVAYLVYRQCVTKAVMYSPNQYPNERLIIRLEVPNSLEIDTDLLCVPLSVKFKTTGTPLEGATIKCDACNLISLGNNEYIVEIPYSEYGGALIEKVVS